MSEPIGKTPDGRDVYRTPADVEVPLTDAEIRFWELVASATFARPYVSASSAAYNADEAVRERRKRFGVTR